MRLTASSLILVLLARVALADGGAELTLEAAINRALAQNRDLALSYLAVRSGEIDLRAAAFEFKPTLSPRINAETDDDETVTEAGLSAGLKTRIGTQATASFGVRERDSEEDETRAEAALRVEVRQPLLKNAGRLVQMEPTRRAESSLLSLRRRVEQNRADLILQVARTHQDLARLQQQVLFDEQAVERYRKLEKLTRTRAAQGRATQIDSLRVEFQRGQAEFDLANTREQLRSVQQDLADLMGDNPNTVYVAVAAPELDLVLPDQPEGVALSNRLDFADAQQRVADSRRGVKVADRNLLPTLDLVAGYDRESEGEDIGSAMSLEEDTWRIGLAGDSDVFRRDERANASRARIDAQSAEESLASVESNIRKDVLQAIQSYERTRAQVGFARRNYELAGDRARLARRLFQLGRGDNFTVTDAEAELLSAQSQLLQSRAETTIAAYQVMRALGTLVETPDDLRPQPL